MMTKGSSDHRELCDCVQATHPQDCSWAPASQLFEAGETEDALINSQPMSTTLAVSWPQ